MEASNSPSKKLNPLAGIGKAHQSLNSVVTDAIREAIFMGQFKPGERLPETKLAELFEVSRIPIREALRVLAYEGIVEINPRKGARVPLLSPEELTEIIELRAELEGISARNAARDCSPEDREKLQQLLDEGNKAASNKDLETLNRVNSEFHAVLADAGKNRYLAEFAKSLRDRTFWLFSARSEERNIESWREHSAILEAVMAHDEQLAAALASRHVKQVGTHVSEVTETSKDNS